MYHYFPPPAPVARRAQVDSRFTPSSSSSSVSALRPPPSKPLAGHSWNCCLTSIDTELVSAVSSVDNFIIMSSPMNSFGGAMAAGSSNPAGTNTASMMNPISRGVEYRCGDCGGRQLLKSGDAIRCHKCGFRILYKVRTKRRKWKVGVVDFECYRCGMRASYLLGLLRNFRFAVLFFQPPSTQLSHVYSMLQRLSSKRGKPPCG